MIRQSCHHDGQCFPYAFSLSLASVMLVVVGCSCGVRQRVVVVPFHADSRAADETGSPEAKALCEAIADSIRVGVERAVVWPPPGDDDRIAPWTSIRIENAPCDLAFEIVWPEISCEAFGVIWARQGENSTFQPVRMLIRSAWQPTWERLWPPMHIRTVDVLLRPSPAISYPTDAETGEPGPHNRLDLMHAGMTEAWSAG